MNTVIKLQQKHQALEAEIQGTAQASAAFRNGYILLCFTFCHVTSTWLILSTCWRIGIIVGFLWEDQWTNCLPWLCINNCWSRFSCSLPIMTMWNSWSILSHAIILFLFLQDFDHLLCYREAATLPVYLQGRPEAEDWGSASKQGHWTSSQPATGQVEETQRQCYCKEDKARGSCKVTAS